MEDISLHKLYWGVTKIIPKLARVAWKVMEASRMSWIIGEGNGTLCSFF